MIVFVANIYLMANLSHPNDTRFGKSWLSKIFVFTGLCLVLIPVIYVFQDIEANKHNEIYEIDYYVLNNGTKVELDEVHLKFQDPWLHQIMFQSMFVWIICPLGLFFYESNENQTLIRRMIGTVKKQLPMLGFLLFFMIVSGLTCRNSYIPEDIGLTIF